MVENTQGEQQRAPERRAGLPNMPWNRAAFSLLLASLLLLVSFVMVGTTAGEPAGAPLAHLPMAPAQGSYRFDEEFTTTTYENVTATTAHWNTSLGWLEVPRQAGAIPGWTSQDSQTANMLKSVSFYSASTGWAVGEGGLVLRTLDGGANWTQQVSGSSSNLNGVHFVDPNTGWVVGDGGTVLKTTDGGDSWTAQTSGVVDEHLNGVYFVNANTGWAVGERGGGRGTILKTTDGGSSWTAQTSGVVNVHLNSVYFVDANTGWVVGDSDIILKTTNGGASWTAETTDVRIDLNGAYFVDANTGWAVGSDGTILKCALPYTLAVVEAESLNVSETSANVVSATLTADHTLEGQSIVYYLSNDAGTNWFEVALGGSHTFTTTGSDLRWRAVLYTTDPAVTPLVDSLSISYQTGVAMSMSATYRVSEGAGTATITVTLGAASTVTVTADYATSDGTAETGTDYTAISGTVTFTPGTTEQTFTVLITNDTRDENDETVLLTLSDPTNASITGTNPATLTIVDDDDPPTVRFISGAYTVDEGAGTATINVILSAASGLTVTVDYATSNGTAAAGSDYTAASGTLTFSPDVISRDFTIAIIDDGESESSESVVLTLSNPNNATISGVNPAVLTITDNDAELGQTTIDKSVSPSGVTTPGQVVSYTYTITISNAGPSNVRIGQVADTLPTGFAYSTTTGATDYPDSIVVSGQEITWSYDVPLPRIDAEDSFTLIFVATSSNDGGNYCNSASVTMQDGGVISRDDLACVGISYPVYQIEARAGGMTIVARVRMEPGGPVIISWEIRR